MRYWFVALVFVPSLYPLLQTDVGSYKREPRDYAAQINLNAKELSREEEERLLSSLLNGTADELLANQTAEAEEGIHANASQSAHLQDVFARYDALREEGLRKVAAMLQQDYLVGFKKAAIVERICGEIENTEVRQMCRRRGRRIGEILMKNYPKKLTTADAVASQRNSLRYTVRAVLQDGKLVGWNIWDTKNNMRDFWDSERLKTAYVLARIRGLSRKGKLNHRGTVELLFHGSDVCSSKKQPYPITWFANGENCPHVVPLSANYLQQADGFTAHDKVLPYDELTNKVFFRASGYNVHRWDVFFLSATKALPFLDARQYASTPVADLGRCAEYVKHDWKVIRPFYKKVGAKPHASQCRFSHKRSVHITKPDSHDFVLKHKYHLIVDGFVTTYRLGPMLQAPGVLMLLQQTATNMSYTPDLVPFVHYLPIDPDRRKLAESLSTIYQWAEQRPEVTRNIAEESTRWAKLHAESAAHDKDWELYIAFLADMRKGEGRIPEMPEKTWNLAHPCPRNPHNQRKFFRKSHFPFDASSVPPKQRSRVVDMACYD